MKIWSSTLGFWICFALVAINAICLGVATKIPEFNFLKPQFFVNELLGFVGMIAHWAREKWIDPKE